MPARKLAETDVQIQALQRHVLAQCVAVTSSIDTIPPEMILPDVRERWLHELRQTVVAAGPIGRAARRSAPGRGSAMIAAIACKSTSRV
jgi:hypothetical protein